MFCDESCQLLKDNKDFISRISNLGKGKLMVAMSDNCGNVSALACLGGTNNLLMGMIENPEFIKQALDKIVFACKKTQAKSFEITKKCDYGGSAHG
ncbi:MAG: hypothetical protein RR444_07945 [Oscillospiraceae bacterium]